MKSKIIQLSKDKAVEVTPSGKDRLVEIRELKEELPVKGGLNFEDITNNLGSVDTGLYEVEAILNSIDSFLTDRFITGIYLEEDPEAKDEIRKALKLLDIVTDKVDTIKRQVSISHLSLLLN